MDISTIYNVDISTFCRIGQLSLYEWKIMQNKTNVLLLNVIQRDPERWFFPLSWLVSWYLIENNPERRSFFTYIMQSRDIQRDDSLLHQNQYSIQNLKHVRERSCITLHALLSMCILISGASRSGWKYVCADVQRNPSRIIFLH